MPCQLVEACAKPQDDQNDGSGASTPDREQRLPSNVTGLAGHTVVPFPSASGP